MKSELDKALEQGVDSLHTIAGHESLLVSGGRHHYVTVVDEGPVSDIGLDGRVITWARKVFIRKDDAPETLAQDDRITIGDDVFYIAEIREAGGIILDLYLSETTAAGSTT